MFRFVQCLPNAEEESTFLQGCVYIFDAYKVYWTSCVKGIHTGKMVLRLVEAIGEFLQVLIGGNLEFSLTLLYKSFQTGSIILSIYIKNFSFNHSGSLGDNIR